MGVSEELASALGTRTREANEAAAERCLAGPATLEELAAAPVLREEFRELARRFAGDLRPGVRKAARALSRMLDGARRS